MGVIEAEKVAWCAIPFVSTPFPSTALLLLACVRTRARPVQVFKRVRLPLFPPCLLLLIFVCVRTRARPVQVLGCVRCVHHQCAARLLPQLSLGRGRQRSDIRGHVVAVL